MDCRYNIGHESVHRHFHQVGNVHTLYACFPEWSKMSEEDNQVLQAQIKDGQLQIIEVNPYAKEAQAQTRNMPDLNSESSSDEPKYVLDPQKGLVPLDLLNLTLVKCDNSYQLVANADSSRTDSETEIDQAVTCVLQASDGEENQEAYVMMDNERCPVVFLQSSHQSTSAEKETKDRDFSVAEEDKEDKTEEKVVKELTPEELMEKAKEVVKSLTPRGDGSRGRKRAGALPPAHELLASPNFKLFLYSCRLCSFKCNAIKELTAHKAAEHGGGRYRSSGGGRTAPALQCARCPYRATHHHQLMKHVQEKHISEDVTETMNLESIETEIADVLVCGACGFESSSKVSFKKHIQKHINKPSS